MKKINKLWLLAMPLAFAACQNDTFEEFVQPSKGGFTLHATVEDETPQSRAQIQLYNTDKGREYFMWNDQDQISVFNKADLEAGSTTFYISGNELDWNPTKSADFVSIETLEEDTEIAAVYPNVADAPVAEGMIGLEIPNYGNALISNEREHYWNYEESWRNYMKERMFMYASGKVVDHSASLHFRHLFAMARITIINTTEQEQRLNTVGLTGDAAYFASHTALDMATGKTTPINMHNMATVTYDNGGRVLQPGESADTYVIFFPGANFTEYGTIQVMNGEKTSPILDTKDIVMANATRAVRGFEAGMRYWFNIVITDEGLAWAKQGGPQITNIPLIAAIEEATDIQFAKTREGYVNVYENYSTIRNITWLDLDEKGLTDLAGIEYFSNLQGLYCNDNELTSLDVSKNKQLRVLYAHRNKLTSLITNEALDNLGCGENNLTQLDVTKCANLTFIHCGMNQLTSLDLTNCPLLQNVNCYTNQITSLDLTNCVQFRGISCEQNPMTELKFGDTSQLVDLYIANTGISSLPITYAPKLENLTCQGNGMTELDVTNMPSLVYLDCDDNQLATLQLGYSPKLTTLYCSLNQLTSLDLSNCPALVNFWANGNQLTSLDASRCPNLKVLGCESNKLASLNVSNCTSLTQLYLTSNNLTKLDVTGCTALERLNCVDNQLSKLDISQNINLIEVHCGIQRSEDGREMKIAVKITDQQKANNVVNLEDWGNDNVVFGDGIPVVGGNGEVDDFASGGKF